MSVVGAALRGFGKALKLGKQKTTGTEVISSVKPSVPKTKSEKLKSQLSIAKQKTKASKARLDNTIFRINQQSKRLNKD
tara:strand:- start:218 stop:454 length:237 start_codon:yes stop_codon:yes gene_type:complete